MDPSAPVRDLAARIGELRDMDTVDTCRFRLVALRTRIESNWPAAGGGLFRRQKGLARDSELTISDLLGAQPTPAPPTAKASAGQGAEPVSRARRRLPRVRP